jgi:hypothetical protein
MSSQNHTTNANTASISIRKISVREAFLKEKHRSPPECNCRSAPLAIHSALPTIKISVRYEPGYRPASHTRRFFAEPINRKSLQNINARLTN